MYSVYISSVHFAYLDLMTPLGSRSEKSQGNGLSADGSDLDRNRNQPAMADPTWYSHTVFYSLFPLEFFFLFFKILR